MPYDFDEELTVCENAQSAHIVSIAIDPDNMKMQIQYNLLDANGNRVETVDSKYQDLLLEDGVTPIFDAEDHTKFATAMESIKDLGYKFGRITDTLKNPGTVS